MKIIDFDFCSFVFEIKNPVTDGKVVNADLIASLSLSLSLSVSLSLSLPLSLLSTIFNCCVIMTDLLNCDLIQPGKEKNCGRNK